MRRVLESRMAGGAMCKPNRSQRIQWWLTDRMLAATEISGERMIIGIVAGLLAGASLWLLFCR